MSETKTRQPNRSKKEIVEELDKKIAYHLACIESLKAKKEQTLNPKMTTKQQLKAVLEQAEKQGISPEEIAKKLGVKL